MMAALLLLLLAPAPPDRDFNESYLVGHWSYEYHGDIGKVILYEDGTLIGFEKQSGGISDIRGQWYFDRGRLQIHMKYYCAVDPKRSTPFSFRTTDVKVYSWDEFQIWQKHHEIVVTFKFTRRKR